jgi:hypothetical protein
MKTSKLYRVVYDRREHEVVLAVYQYSYKDHLVNAWLDENCQGRCYHSPGYFQEKFIEFEDSQDATVFALKWGR